VQRHHRQPEGHARADGDRDEREPGTTEGRHDAEASRNEGSIRSGQRAAVPPGEQLACAVPILGGTLVPASAAPRMRSPICAWAGQRTGKRRGGGSRARCVSGPWVVGGTGGRQGSVPLPFQLVKVTRDQSGCPRGGQMPYECASVPQPLFMRKMMRSSSSRSLRTCKRTHTNCMGSRHRNMLPSAETSGRCLRRMWSFV